MGLAFAKANKQVRALRGSILLTKLLQRRGLFPASLQREGVGTSVWRESVGKGPRQGWSGLEAGWRGEVACKRRPGVVIYALPLTQVCTDINECETGKHNCVPNSVCVNTRVRPGRRKG